MTVQLLRSNRLQHCTTYSCSETECLSQNLERRRRDVITAERQAVGRASPLWCAACSRFPLACKHPHNTQAALSTVYNDIVHHFSTNVRIPTQKTHLHVSQWNSNDTGIHVHGFDSVSLRRHGVLFVSGISQRRHDVIRCRRHRRWAHCVLLLLFICGQTTLTLNFS